MRRGERCLREPVHVRTHAVADGEDQLDDRFLASGVLEWPRVHGVVACVAVELLHNLACFLVAAPEVCWVSLAPRPAGRPSAIDPPGTAIRDNVCVRDVAAVSGQAE